MTRILARVGPKGQVVVPKPVRDELKIQPGDELYFSTHGAHAHLEKVAGRQTLQEIFEGIPKRRLPPDVDFDALFEESYDE
jgi:AbrB family looped-hinge helix DNA binding protein